MASVHDLMSIARDPNFQDRIKYSLQQSALDVMAEAGNVTGHALRVTFAGRVLAGTVDIFQVAISVLNNSTIAAEANVALPIGAAFGIPDSDLPFTVNSLFNAFAGVAN